MAALAAGGLLVALLLLGASLYRGYGLTWDEPNNHYNGVVNLHYAAEFLLSAAVVRRLMPPACPCTPRAPDRASTTGWRLSCPPLC